MNNYNNPFIYSDDNKRYHSWNYYLKHKYNHKVFKVALNTNFGCPNRDGTCGVGGCIFCSSLGSGDCAGNIKDDLNTQFNEGKAIMLNKWPKGIAMAYFQAFSNTYAPLSTLHECFDQFIDREDCIGLCIATRADCLDDKKIAYLDSLTTKKEVWIELGLQSIYDTTAELTNRGHNYEQFKDMVYKLSKTNLKICVHLMNSLPNETAEMMINSAYTVGQLPIHAIKIHMLHILKNTKISDMYLNNEFKLQTIEEYIDTIVKQLEVIPNNIIIQRLTGDGIKDLLIAPLWTIKKTIVLNNIDKLLLKRNSYQGISLPYKK
ncbi:MAG: TIGR01212 family radical SAM protein [Erysipelotrichaceae bacterium]